MAQLIKPLPVFRAIAMQPFAASSIETPCVAQIHLAMREKVFEAMSAVDVEMVRTFIKRIGIWSSVVAAKTTEPEIDRCKVRPNSIISVGHDTARRFVQVEYFNGTL
ncbi:MAG: hypothetical protein AAFY74_16235 [Pseudomonadota bacterium]